MTLLAFPVGVVGNPMSAGVFDPGSQEIKKEIE